MQSMFVGKSGSMAPGKGGLSFTPAAWVLFLAPTRKLHSRIARHWNIGRTAWNLYTSKVRSPAPKDGYFRRLLPFL